MAIDTTTDRFASLAVVNYEALANKDAAEIQKLVTAGQSVGMWYVDLRGPRTKSFLEDVPAIFKTGQEFFSLPLDSEEKVKVIREGNERGHEKMDRG
jgi:isopenicillin N synthase-like dioxygenase